MYQRLADSASPPSAADLAEAFAEAANYNHFKWALQRIRNLESGGAWDQAGLLALLRAMSDLLGLGSPTPSLLEVASYYEYTFKRQRLREFLAGIFNDRKSEPTRTQRSVASAARVYIDANQSDNLAGDYLIITTNYDGLIEIALDLWLDGGKYAERSTSATRIGGVDQRADRADRQNDAVARLCFADGRGRGRRDRAGVGGRQGLPVAASVEGQTGGIGTLAFPCREQRR